MWNIKGFHLPLIYIFRYEKTFDFFLLRINKEPLRLRKNVNLKGQIWLIADELHETIRISFLAIENCKDWLVQLIPPYAVLMCGVTVDLRVKN